MQALLLALNLVAAAPDCATQILVHNARVYTVNESAPSAEALAFDACGNILAVGSDEQLQADYPGAKALDASGATIVPGLIDAHGHITGLGQLAMRADLIGAASKAEVLRRLQAFERDLAPGQWLLGRGWDQNDWSDGREFPHRSDLDALFPERPVWLQRVDGHAGWANSAALAEADRDFSGDWQVAGGEIMRDADGQPIGIFIDRARALIESQVPPPDADVKRRALTLAFQRAVSAGLTGIHEAGTSAEMLARYRNLEISGQLPIRIYAMADGEQQLFEQLCSQGPVATARVVARSVKLYADGALGSRGAALLQDYSDRPGNRGLLLQTPQQLWRQVDRAMGCGLQVNLHAIGDHANRVALDLLIEGMRKHPDNPGRHRVEHAQVIHPDDQSRFARHEIIASVQPTHATSDMYWAAERLGDSRVATAYLWRSLLETGARLALGSDFPVESPDPMTGIHAAVTRTDAEGWPKGGWQASEALTPAQALHGFTLGAAWAAFMEDQVGSLQAGKRADFVVLSSDILAIDPARLLQARALVTVVDGRRVYLAADAPADWSALPVGGGQATPQPDD